MSNFYANKGKSAFMIAVASAAFLYGCQEEPLLEAPVNPSTVSAPLEEMSVVKGPKGERFVANEVLVKFKPGASADVKSLVLSRVNASAKEKILTKAMERFGDSEGLVLVRTPMAVLDAVGRLKGMAEVEYAEPNYVYTHDAASNDPYYTDGSLWGMLGDATSPANEYGSQAGEAWANNHVGSSDVIIGVIDEGVMYFHEDLQANMWVNPYDAEDGVDNDGNGYVDDVYGWDFDRNDNTTYDGTQDNHGTHVAGTIGGIGGNGKGVAGVSWSVKMITAKFLGRNGGTTANAIKSVDYITDLKTRHGLKLVGTNNSWGGGGFSQGLYDAIERANAADILFMAAAGNGGNDGVGDDNDTSPHYPSSYANSNIIAVASITKDGSKSGFSNYGATSVDIGAPGSAIFSTIPGRGNTSSYGSYSGTSMATPHVCGGVALYAATHTAGAAAIKQAIFDSAVPTASLSGKCVTGGRLNVSGF
jgi:subtilisin family serine protease